MASAVIFRDDTSFQDQGVSRESLLHGPLMRRDPRDGDSPSDTPSGDDVFLISRMNDCTSYFFTWFCRRSRFRLLSAATPCPICLETVTTSIELPCGHAFCRSCLTTSAAKNFNACALCRREQVLHPEVLRAQFDERRMINLAKRLGSTGFAQTFVAPPVKPRPATSHAPEGVGVSKKHRCRSESWDSSSRLSAELRRAQASMTGSRRRKVALSNKDARARARLSDTGSLATLGHLLFGPWGDVGSMSGTELRKRWERARRAGLSPPIAPVDEVARKPALPAEVGAMSVRALAPRWRSLHSSASRDGSAQGGSRRQLKRTRLSPPPGGPVRARFAPLAQQRLDAGEEEEGGEDDGTVGALSRTAVQVLSSFGRGGADIGATPISELSERWHGLVCSARRGEEAATVGQLSPSELRQRWQAASTSAGDAGAARLHVLADRLAKARAPGAMGARLCVPAC